MSEIQAIIKSQTPKIAALYAKAFRSAYAQVANWEAQNPGRRAGNDWFMAGPSIMARMVTSYKGGTMRTSKYMDEAKVTKHSEAQAEALCAQYAFKVESKAEGMTDVKVSEMDDAGSFTITGVKAGKDIEIRQSVVVKTSPKGKWFCQFPALVYIDGRKSTEKALKAL